MASMKTAYFYGGKDIRVVEEDVPVPGAGEVLFRVMSAGVCGSDLHNYRGHRTRDDVPWQQGHELSGVVARGWRRGERSCGGSAGWDRG